MDYSQIPSSTYYDDGWGEYIIGIPLLLGIEFEFTKFLLSAEYRFLIYGEASTDWEPYGDDPEQYKSPYVDCFQVGMGLRL